MAVVLVAVVAVVRVAVVAVVLMPVVAVVRVAIVAVVLMAIVAVVYIATIISIGLMAFHSMIRIRILPITLVRTIAAFVVPPLRLVVGAAFGTPRSVVVASLLIALILGGSRDRKGSQQGEKCKQHSHDVSSSSSNRLTLPSLLSDYALTSQSLNGLP